MILPATTAESKHDVMTYILVFGSKWVHSGMYSKFQIAANDN
jgi:hypothetical protein